MATENHSENARDAYIEQQAEECKEELRLISLAVHDDAEKRLRRIFEEPRIHAWSFNELVFWNQPIRRGREADDKNTAGPFLPFVSHRFSQVPSIADFESLADQFRNQSSQAAMKLVELLRQVQMAPTTKDTYDPVQKAIEVGINFSKTEFGRKVLESWSSESSTRTPGSAVVEDDLNRMDKSVLARYETPEANGAYPFLIGERSLENLLADFAKDAPNSENWYARVAEYALHDHVWILGLERLKDEEKFRKQATYLSCIVPIASAYCFYGYFVLYCPPLFSMAEKRETDEKREEGRREARKLARDIVKTLLEVADEYLPILTLYHFRWSERFARNRLEKLAESDLEGDEGYMKFGEHAQQVMLDADVFLQQGRSDEITSDMERDLHSIWQTRMILILELQSKGTVERKKSALKFLQNSFVLADYGMVSAPMLGILRRLPDLARVPSTSRSLPCVLIVGGAGSGKEMMSELVQLFFKEYAFGSRMVVNMAALRPQAVVAPVLLGFELSDVLKVTSILEQFASNPDQQGQAHFGATVVFDELNSLDIDQQGVLLRILENGEILPLGKHESTNVNFLCIGIMNEIPHDLMKESELAEGFAHSQIFGSVVGTMLEELFRKSRRLRPDLYYRFARIEPIMLPALRERHREIPFLFRLKLMKFRDAVRPLDTVDIDVGALRFLMDTRLQWAGNMRELEAVAAEAWTLAFASRKGNKVRVTLTMVENAVETVRRRTRAVAFERRQDVTSRLKG